MTAGDSLNRDQYSVFGGRAGYDQESEAIGKMNRSYRGEMADRIIAKTPLGPSGHHPMYRETLMEHGMTHADRLALEHRPPSRVDIGWGGSADQVGSYDPYEGIVEVRPPGVGGASRKDDLHTMAHELGHHIHLSNTLGHVASWNTAGGNPDPVHEGVAEGFADKVTGRSPLQESSDYPEHFNTAPSVIGDMFEPEGAEYAKRPLLGPGRAMKYWVDARHAAHAGEFTAPDKYNRRAEWPEYEQGKMF